MPGILTYDEERTIAARLHAPEINAELYGKTTIELMQLCQYLHLSDTTAHYARLAFHFGAVALRFERHRACDPHCTMNTMINGQPAEWTPAIWRLWHTHAENIDPKYRTAPVLSANYFTPRPYIDQYNRGSNEAGFTYTIELPSYRREVCQVKWSEAYK